MPAVDGLLPTEPDALEFCVVEFEETFRREWRGEREETLESGVGRGERNLLLKDDVNEGRETGRAKPFGRRAKRVENVCEVRIARGQRAQPCGVRLFV
jgi:hypothetical protein